MTIKVEHKVDKGVPIPVNHTLPLTSLDVGESIKFPIEDRQKVASRASTLKRRRGLEFTIRKEDDKYCRVWRTK